MGKTSLHSNRLIGIVGRIGTILALFSLACVSDAHAGRNVWTPFGPAGGSVWVLAVDPTSDDTVYALTERGGFRTTDAGVTWQSLGIYGYSLAIDPVTPTTIYVGGQNEWGHGLVYKSIDAGASWSEGVEVGGDLIQTIVVDPVNPRMLFALVTSGEIAHSIDAGSTWRIVAVLSNVEGPLAFDPRRDVLYVASRYGILSSTDRGVSWNLNNLGWGSFNELVVDGTDTGIVYAARPDSVLRSLDHGVSWETVNTGLPTETIYSLAVDPSAPATLYAGTSRGVFKTTTGGTELRPIGLDALSAGSLAVASSGRVYVGLRGLGVARSDDGGATWTRSGNGLGRAPAFISIDPFRSRTLYAASEGLFRSIDNGESWEWSSAGLIDATIGALAFHPRTADALFVGTCAGVFQSNDAGRTWQPTGLTYEPSHYSTVGCVSSIAVDPGDPLTMYIAGKVVLKTSDGGITWSTAKDELPLYIGSLVIDPHDSATLYAVAEFPPTDDGCGLFKSVDAGQHWTCIGEPGVEYSGLVVDPHVRATLYTGTRYWPSWGSNQDEFPGGVFKSTDGGATWIATTLGQPYLAAHVEALQIDPIRSRTLYTATWDGMFVTDDGGLHWKAINAGIGRWFDDRPRAFAVDGRSRTVYAGSSYGAYVIERVDPCRGDCNLDGIVTIDEVMRAVGISLGTADVDTCSVLDNNGSTRVEIYEIVASVRDLLDGCGR